MFIVALKSPLLSIKTFVLFLSLRTKNKYAPQQKNTAYDTAMKLYLNKIAHSFPLLPAAPMLTIDPQYYFTPTNSHTLKYPF